MSQEAARQIRASDRAARLVDRMSDDLGLWDREVDAALFLGALAIHKGREPVALDEQTGTQAVGNLSSITEGVGDAGALELFGLTVDEQRGLDEVLLGDLPGLIEAGAELLEPAIDGPDPLGAIAEMLEPGAA